jgi:DNA-binding transcriptional MocR family regulator
MPELVWEGSHAADYVDRAIAMGNALKRELSDAIELTQPQGGLFFWVTRTGAGGKIKNGGGVCEEGDEAGRGVCARGAVFFGWPEVSIFRLSFATADIAKIKEGVGRLGKAL